MTVTVSFTAAPIWLTAWGDDVSFYHSTDYYWTTGKPGTPPGGLVADSVSFTVEEDIDTAAYLLATGTFVVQFPLATLTTTELYFILHEQATQNVVWEIWFTGSDRTVTPGSMVGGDWTVRVRPM